MLTTLIVVLCCIIIGKTTAAGSGRSSYVIWGRTKCPSTPHTHLVYSGRVGGTFWKTRGGASNYLCLPDDPEYLNTVAGVGGSQALQALIFGAEYETGVQYNCLGPLGDVHQQYNVPCAVCEIGNRGLQLMIPAKTSCPDQTWTREYNGYLMTQSTSNDVFDFYRTEYICVDKDAENIPGSSQNTNGILLFHVRPYKCGTEYLPCTYDPEKELACVVCSK